MNHSSFFSAETFRRLILGAALEFSPIIIFLISFKHFRIYEATLILMIATIISTVVTYRVQKRLPYLALYVAFLTTVFGYLTLMHQQPRFIQMRDTLYDVTCALTLLAGLMINVHFLKLAFHEVIPMTLRAWNRLTYAWILFFVANAIANEYVRRTVGLHEWFHFKSYVVIVTIVFGITSLYFFYEKPESEE
jgi:intracellular septation protein